MKKKIAILGSTGSIGKSLINILKCDKKNIEIKLISANKNINELLKQTKIFNVKNIIVSDYKKFIQLKKILHNKKINIYNNFNSIDKIFHENKIDYSMNAISGLNGLNINSSSVLIISSLFLKFVLVVLSIILYII